MNTLERLRAKRAERLARREAEVNQQGKEYLNTAILPKGVSIWFPQGDKPSEHEMRILQFEVKEAANIGGEAVGDFASKRVFKIHYNIGIGGHTIVCPTSYNQPCPICEAYEAYPKEERLRRDSPASKLKPKNVAIFNALFKEPGEDGKNVLKLRVVRGGDYALTSTLNSTLKEEVELNKKDAEKIYLYDDLELGYWITARFAKTTMTGKGGDPFMQITRVDLGYKAEPKAVSDKIIEKIVDLDKLIPKAPTYDDIVKMLGGKLKDASSVEDESEFAEEVETPKKSSTKDEEILEDDEPPKKAKPLKDTFSKPSKPTKSVEEASEEEADEDAEDFDEVEEEVEEVEEDSDEVEEDIEEVEEDSAPAKKATAPAKKAPALTKATAPAKAVASPIKKATAPAKKATAPAKTESEDDEFGSDFDED